MKILFLTAFVPHEGAAAEKNTKLMIEDLSCDNQVDLFFFKYRNDPQYIQPNKNVRIIGVSKNSIIKKLANILCFPFVYPLFSVRFNWLILNKLKKHVKVNRYDAIICDHSQMFLYGKYLKGDNIKILISHDVIAQRVERTSSKLLLKICKMSELYCLSQKNANIFTLCQKDCNLIKKNYELDAHEINLYLSPNVMRSMPSMLSDYFVFIGKWSRPDNLDGVVWFIEKVAPLIKKKTIIKIIGTNFPTKHLKNTNNNISYEILGFVDDPYPIISNAKAMLAPLFTGAGIKVKVVESLACGTPIIGTDIAFEGISTSCSDAMTLANDPNSFAKSMNDINISLEQRKKIKKTFLEEYSSNSIPKFLKHIR